jgi:hypothetical protein
MFDKVTAQAAPIYSNWDKLTGQRKVAFLKNIRMLKS